MSGLKAVWSVNEWGKLMETIVGNPHGAYIPSMDDISQISFDRPSEEDLKKAAPGLMPQFVVDETLEDIEELVKTLERMDIKITRSNPLSLTEKVHSPLWKADQETAVNIRDLTLVHGDMAIQAPSPTRGRYFEGNAVNSIFNDYYIKNNQLNAIQPPRPTLDDRNYNLTDPCGLYEVEPLFDAANCLRFGRDVLIDINNTANRLGAKWLQEAFNIKYGENQVKVHTANYSPDHIDVVMVPLCEGTLLVNPEFVNDINIPEFLKSWDIIISPEMAEQPYYTGTAKASNWIGMNLLVINGEEKTVLVEDRQIALIRKLEELGFRPIPQKWRHGRSWGGSFHCVTLDTHRISEL